MGIKIKDVSICNLCGNKDCSFKDSVVKTSFYGLRTEETICPTAVITDGPVDVSKNNIIENKHCIDCGLCALNCHNNNLECFDIDYSSTSFMSLSTQQTNAIACSYLNHIFTFATNTNRNKSLQFDGYISTNNGIEAFVQIDMLNDSLESVRRLIGDFLLYSPSDRRIKMGIVVLNELPREGSRDIYNVLKKIREFPTTNDYQFYFTTLNLLKYLAININNCNYNFEDIFFDLLQEDSINTCYKKFKELFPDDIKIIKQLIYNQ